MSKSSRKDRLEGREPNRMVETCAIAVAARFNTFWPRIYWLLQLWKPFSTHMDRPIHMWKRSSVSRSRWWKMSKFSYSICCHDEWLNDILINSFTCCSELSGCAMLRVCERVEGRENGFARSWPLLSGLERISLWNRQILAAGHKISSPKICMWRGITHRHTHTVQSVCEDRIMVLAKALIATAMNSERPPRNTLTLDLVEGNFASCHSSTESPLAFMYGGGRHEVSHSAPP